MADIEARRPKVPELVIDLPAIPVLVIGLPEPSVYFLPAGFIPPFIPETAAEAFGEGTAVVRPIVVVVAVASGSGVGRVPPAGRVSAVATGSGIATVTAVTLFATAVTASGSGTSTVRPSAVVGISATGSGSATAGVPSAVTAALASGAGSAIVRPSGVVQVRASGSGSAIVPAYELGAAYPTSIVASGEGTATVTAMAARTTLVASGEGTATVTPVTFTNMGMRKNGNQTFSDFGTTTRKATGWTAATTEMPGSVVTSDTLGPAVGSATRTVYAPVNMTSSAAACTVTIMKNASTSLGTLSWGANVGGVKTFTLPNHAIAPGDTFWLNVTYGTGGQASRTLVAADTLIYYA